MLSGPLRTPQGSLTARLHAPTQGQGGARDQGGDAGGRASGAIRVVPAIFSHTGEGRGRAGEAGSAGAGLVYPPSHKPGKAGGGLQRAFGAPERVLMGVRAEERVQDTRRGWGMACSRGRALRG